MCRTDCSTWSFTGWGQDQPNNGGGDDHCTGIYYNPGKKYHQKWSDRPCDSDNDRKDVSCTKKLSGQTSTEQASSEELSIEHLGAGAAVGVGLLLLIGVIGGLVWRRVKS